MGIFDIVCTANTRLKFPQLYSQTLDTFNVRIFWIWVVNALLHSFLLFWICMFAMKHEVVWSNGKEGGYLLMGNFIYTVKAFVFYSVDNFLLNLVYLYFSTLSLLCVSKLGYIYNPGLILYTQLYGVQ